MKKIFTILGIACASVLMNAQVSIAQIYVGGGNSGANYNRDYVVLFNKTSSSVDISGWSIQYAAAANSGAWSGKATITSGAIAPYSYYLVALATANINTGAALPTPDFDGGTAGINMGANGKVALMNNSTTINGAAPVGAIDFVGMGTANAKEGSATAPAGTATNALLRANGGCTDTDDNGADFVLALATPLNSSSATNVCASLGTSDAKSVKVGSFIKNSFVKNNEIVFGSDVKDVKVFNMFGQLVKEASVKQNGAVSVAELAKGNYIVTGTVNNQPISQKVLKD